MKPKKITDMKPKKSVEKAVVIESIESKVPAVFASSNNPTEVSMTIQGLIISLVPLAIGIMQAKGINITEGEMVNIIKEGFAVLSMAVMTFGGLRKVLQLIKNVLK